MSQPWFAPSIFVLMLCLAPAASAASISFETAEGYTLGPLSPSGGPVQGDWSGGAQAGFTNNDPGDEQIVDTHANTGSHSWHYARGYGSPGQGTPFSPSLPTPAGPGTQLDFSIHFHAADASGDGSEQNIYMGTTAGDDRTAFNLYLENAPSGDGLHLYTYDWSGGATVKTIFATGLDRTSWHQIEVSATFGADPDDDTYEYSVNGTLAFSGNSWPNPWRESNGFGLVYGDSIKFADGGGDDLAHQGFYYDDLAYSHSPIPEPSTGLLLLVGTAALSGARLARRRQRR